MSNEQSIIDPPYYTKFKIQPYEYGLINNSPFWEINIIKYLLRAGHKNGVKHGDDITKIYSYFNKTIEFYKKQEDNHKVLRNVDEETGVIFGEMSAFNFCLHNDITGFPAEMICWLSYARRHVNSGEYGFAVEALNIAYDYFGDFVSNNLTYSENGL